MQPRKLNIRPIRDRESGNAFLLGLIFNQNQKAERAWEAPYALKERTGTLDPKVIANLELEQVRGAVGMRPALHPFVLRTAQQIHATCQLLADEYGGDARKVWGKGNTVKYILSELQKFPGIGEHKATVGVFLLRRHFGIVVKDDGMRLRIRTTCPSLFAIYGDDE